MACTGPAIWTKTVKTGFSLWLGSGCKTAFECLWAKYAVASYEKCGNTFYLRFLPRFNPEHKQFRSDFSLTRPSGQCQWHDQFSGLSLVHGRSYSMVERLWSQGGGGGQKRKKEKSYEPLAKPAERRRKSIGATIRIGREIWCLPYAGFFPMCFEISLFVTRYLPHVWHCNALNVFYT